MNDSTKTLLSIVGPALRASRSRLAWLLGAVFLIAIAQSSLLLVMGPFVKALFGLVHNDIISGTELFSPQIVVFFPGLADWTINRSELAWGVPAGILLASGIRNIATYIYDLNAAALALYIASDYRIRFFDTLIHSSYRMINAKSPGRWMSHIMNDVLFLQTRFSNILRCLVQDTVTMLAALGTMWLVHWPTGLVLTLFAPLVAKLAGRTGKKISGYASVYQHELGSLAASILDLRKRFDFVRCQGGESIELARFEHSNRLYLENIRRSIFVRASFAPGMEFFGFMLFAALIFGVGIARREFGFDSVNLFVFFAALGVMLRPLRNLGEQLARFHETLGSLADSLSVFQAATQSGASALLPTIGSAGIKRSTNSCQSNTLNLDRIVIAASAEFSMTLEAATITPGRTIAVIGPSGAGKSTIIKCLAGLYRPDQWLADSAWQDVAKQSSLVSQEPFLFDASIYENLVYGNQNWEPDSEVLARDRLKKPSTKSDTKDSKNENAIWEVLKRVGLEKEIAQLPHGLATRFNPLNTSLSGGQIQRLAVVRALLRPAKILLFDEATSAIDSEAEKNLLTTLKETCRQETIALVAVTHRLSCLHEYDDVWIVEDGRIIAQGPYQDIIGHESYERLFSAT